MMSAQMQLAAQVVPTLASSFDALLQQMSDFVEGVQPDNRPAKVELVEATLAAKIAQNFTSLVPPC